MDKSYLPIIVDYILTEKIAAIPRLDLAVAYLKKLPKGDTLNNVEFDDVIGVGINITTKDVEDAIDQLLKDKKEELDTLRYGVNQVDYRNEVIKKLRFPNLKEVFDIFKTKFEAYLGPESKEEKEERLNKGKKDAK